MEESSTSCIGNNKIRRTIAFAAFASDADDVLIVTASDHIIDFNG